MKNTLKYLFAMTMAAAGMSANAASGVIELEIPGMNAETAEYIALTDPNDAVSHFNATIAIGADGVPVVGWNTPTYASRTYKVLGKVDLSDSVWIEVKDNASLYRFFKVEVEIK